MMKQYEAVVFDMDGVIFDSEVKVIECWKVIAKKYGIDNIEAACYECLGVNRVETKEKMLRRYGDDFPYDQYKKEQSDLYFERYGEGRIPMKAGIKELLQYLKEQGKMIALASSTREEVVKMQLENAGILSYFDAIVCGDMVKRSKPEPDIFLTACEYLQVAPECAYAIEDSYNGIRSAYRAGMMPIMVPDLIGPDEEMKEKAVCILPSLLEVKSYLEL